MTYVQFNSLQYAAIKDGLAMVTVMIQLTLKSAHLMGEIVVVVMSVLSIVHSASA